MTVWQRNLDLQALNAMAENNMISHLGIRITGIGADSLTASMPVDERTCQPMGFLHGGATAALAETLGSYGALLSTPEQTRILGLELNISHLGTARTGDVFATATPVRLGMSHQVWAVSVRNSHDDPVSEARLTVSLQAPRKSR